MQFNGVWRIFISIVLCIHLMSCTAGTNERELVVYSGRSEAFMQPIIDAFQAQYPDIRVTVKSGKNNELAAAILEERSNPQADVFISTDQLSHINLSKQGGLAASTFANRARIPAGLRDPAHTWFAVTLRVRSIMYNTDLVAPADAPQRMADLADPRWRGQVAIANSSNGPMQAQVASMIAINGAEHTRQWLADLVANDVTFFGGAADLRKAVGSGEFAIGVVNHYNYEVQRREATLNQVGIVYPDQQVGGMGVLVNGTAVGVVANAPHPQAAALFLDFLFMDDTQQLFAELNYEYPVIPGITQAAGIPDLDALHIANTDMLAIADLVPQSIAMMQEVGIP
jgi:iron(III) transport system substrate-binding protein